MDVDNNDEEDDAYEIELEPLTTTFASRTDRFQRQLRWAIGLGVLVGALYLAVNQRWLGNSSSQKNHRPSADSSVSQQQGGGTDAWRHQDRPKLTPAPLASPISAPALPPLPAAAPLAPNDDEPKGSNAAHGNGASAPQGIGNETSSGLGEPKSKSGSEGNGTSNESPAPAPADSKENGEGGSDTSSDAPSVDLIRDGNATDTAPPLPSPTAQSSSLLDFPPGFKPDPNVYSEAYLPRSRPLDEAGRKELTDQWGSWTFVDVEGVDRPHDDYYAQYPSRDVPRSEFPPGAWQTDADFLKDFLPQARALVKRAMEGILAEYGHGTKQEPDRSMEERSEMFSVSVSNDTSQKEYTAKESEGKGTRDAGGYMNERAYSGLVRRLLHAIMTEDTFRVVLGGHSAAAGHGNHFQQSYTLQIQRVLEPVFARVGVTMTAQNMGMGGLGTLQNALGMRDLYGDDTDVLIYDSGMTEIEPEAMDLFMRQGILSGKKVPLLWVNQDFGRFFKAEVFKYLGQECDADVAVYGTGLKGVPLTTSVEQAKGIAWAGQFLKCDPAIKQTCRDKEYMGTCWIERSDVTPFVKQQPEPGGRASWHPGNRFHQLQGRVFTFRILAAMDQALDIWSRSEGYALKDSDWHMNEYYSNIRTKLLAVNHSTPCHAQSKFPTRACDLSLRARSEFVPRQNPYATSILSIVKAGNVGSQVLPNIYDPPDVHNPSLDPVGVDVLRIIENGRDYSPILGRKRRIAERQLYQSKERIEGGSVNPDIKPGLGWELDTNTAPDNCDGSYDSFCGRSNATTCLLYGHNDYRGGLKFDSLSGWLIMNLEQLQHGLIIVKIEDWHYDAVRPTASWTCPNNDCGRDLRRGADMAVSQRRNPVLVDEETVAESSSDSMRAISRNLKPKVPDYCAEFKFEFAIDGRITTWPLEEWQKREGKAQRVVQLWTLLDDPKFVADGRPRDVELALRMLGCGRTKIFKLTHVYWA